MNNFVIEMNDDLDQYLNMAKIDSTLMAAVENISLLTNGLSTTSSIDLAKPEVVEEFRCRVDEICNQLTLPKPDLDGLVVSQEGLLDIPLAIVQRIYEFLRAVKNWFKELLSSSGTVAKAQQGATKLAGNSIINKAKKQDIEVLKVKLPVRALIAFHNSKHTPKTEYTYNLESFKLSTKGVNDDLKKLIDGVEEEIMRILNFVELVTDYLKKGQPITAQLMTDIRRGGLLAHLSGNGFETIGCKTNERTITSNNQMKRGKFDVKDVAGDYGWKSTEQLVEFTIRADELPTFVNLVTEQVGEINRNVIRTIDKIAASKIISKIENIKTNELFKTNDLSGSEKAIQAANIEKLNLVYELALQAEILTASLRGFSQRYTGILTMLVTGLDKGL